MALLWDDVPVEQQLPDSRYGVGWRGCPYAAWDNWDRGYRRCCNAVPTGDPACRSHDPVQIPSPRELNLPCVRALIVRHLQRHQYIRDPLPWFRCLSDKAILDMRSCGVTRAAFLREIRDTWSDDKVVEFFDFPPSPARSPEPPSDFFDRRESIYSLMGG